MSGHRPRGGSNSSRGSNDDKGGKKDQDRSSKRLSSAVYDAGKSLNKLGAGARRLSVGTVKGAIAVGEKAVGTVVDKTVKAGYLVSAVRDEIKNRKKYPTPQTPPSPPPAYKQPEFTQKFQEIARKTLEAEYRSRSFMDVVSLVSQKIKNYNDHDSCPLVGVEVKVITAGGYKNPPVEQDFLHDLQPPEVALIGEIVKVFKNKLEKQDVLLDDDLVDLVAATLVKTRVDTPALYRDATSAELRERSRSNSSFSEEPPALPPEDDEEYDKPQPLRNTLKKESGELSFRGERKSANNLLQASSVKTTSSMRGSSRASSRGSKRVPSGVFIKPVSYNQAVGGMQQLAFLTDIQKLRQSFRPQSGRKSPPHGSPKNRDRDGNSGGSNKV